MFDGDEVSYIVVFKVITESYMSNAIADLGSKVIHMPDISAVSAGVLL